MARTHRRPRDLKLGCHCPEVILLWGDMALATSDFPNARFENNPSVSEGSSRSLTGHIRT